MPTQEAELSGRVKQVFSLTAEMSGKPTRRVTAEMSGSVVYPFGNHRGKGTSTERDALANIRDGDTWENTETSHKEVYSATPDEWLPAGTLAVKESGHEAPMVSYVGTTDPTEPLRLRAAIEAADVLLIEDPTGAIVGYARGESDNGRWVLLEGSYEVWFPSPSSTAGILLGMGEDDRPTLGFGTGAVGGPKSRLVLGSDDGGFRIVERVGDEAYLELGGEGPLTLTSEGHLRFLERATEPDPPPTGYVTVFGMTDHKVYREDEFGVVTELGGGGGGVTDDDEAYMFFLAGAM